MKNGIRLSALSGVIMAGALALAACGSDNNNGVAAAPATAAKDCAKVTVDAAGSSAQKNAVEAWSNGYKAACADATLNYNPAGSGAGIQAFTAGQVAFAGSDSALKPEEVEPVKTRCKGNNAVNLPMVIGPVGVVYNVKGVDGLQMSSKTLAEVFSGKIKTWNDPAIAAENAGAKLPSTAIKPVYRADESGTTDNFTNFLNKTAPDVWTNEHAKTWPIDGGVGQKGSDGVAAAVKETAGSITYVELSFAESLGLKKAKVANGADEFVELTPESASKAIAGAKTTGTDTDIQLEIDYATKEAGAYPIVLATYEIVCTAGNGEKAALIKSFLSYTASSAGQTELTKLGYAPLPEELRVKVETLAKSIA